MRQNFLIALAVCLCAFVASAEQPADKAAAPVSADAEALVKKMMAFDKDGKGHLTRDDITDERLKGIFDRADANKDGVVTKAEISAFAAQETSSGEAGGGGPRGGGPPDGGPPGSGPRGGGPGGDGPPGGGRGGGRGQPGQIMPAFIQDALKLTDDQKKQLADLQKEVDGKVEGLLTDDQKTQLKAMRARGPGGQGGQGGQGGGPGGGQGGQGGGPGGPGGDTRRRD